MTSGREPHPEAPALADGARERADLRAMLEAVADPVVAQGAGGRILYANAAAVRMLGYPDEAALRAAPVDEVRDRMDFRDEQRQPVAVERLPGRRALRGEEPEPIVTTYRPQAGAAEGWARLKARPVRDDRGGVRMAITLVEDITELKRAELEQRFLARAGRVLASSLDYERTLRAVAALAVPEIADWCVVDLRTARGFERVALAHADPSKLARTEEISRRYPPDPRARTGVAEVLRTGEPQLHREITDATLAAVARDEEHLRLLREVGMVSAMVVPMTGGSGPLGAITLASSESGRRFGDADLALAQELGLRAGVAIDNARLYRQRSTIARALQASLLPPELPAIDELEAAAVYRPAGEGIEVGGDFYDLFRTGPGHWLAVVGDVCGKGPEAAAVTAMVRYTVRAAAVGAAEPAEVLRALNDAMLRQEASPLRFCTLAIARLDLSSDGSVRVCAAAAGHPLPRVVRAGGAVERLGAPGTPVGITDDLRIEQRATDLRPGDALALFTDGIVEARAPATVWSADDVDREIGAVAALPLDELVEAFAAAATGGETAAPLRDDLAVLALRVRA